MAELSATWEETSSTPCHRRRQSVEKLSFHVQPSSIQSLPRLDRDIITLFSLLPTQTIDLSSTMRSFFSRLTSKFGSGTGRDSITNTYQQAIPNVSVNFVQDGKAGLDLWSEDQVNQVSIGDDCHS